MKKIDWRDIDERHLEAFCGRVALVETLLDECIDDGERKQVHFKYLEEHGVSDRTIRNYLHKRPAEQSLLIQAEHPTTSSRHPALWSWCREMPATEYGFLSGLGRGRCARVIYLRGLMTTLAGLSMPSISGMRNCRGSRRLSKPWFCVGGYRESFTWTTVMYTSPVTLPSFLPI